MNPIIAMTTSRQSWQASDNSWHLMGAGLADDYARSVEDAGGVPWLIPYLRHPETIAFVAERADALILTGGDDMSPRYYGEQPRSGLRQVTPERDYLESLLFAAFRMQNKPILGICRGLQVINVLLGGNLYQDLEREWRGCLQHEQHAPRSHFAHTVRIDPESILAVKRELGEEIWVNSYHHQAIHRLASGLRPIAWDEEGLVEAFVSLDGNILAVQWHPENTAPDDTVSRRIFEWLVERAVTVESHSGA
ncbi:gamma-glutamyl-gamma-aminobutyrate hydrolase family protein [Alicyclobacillus tolerans]|uniref:gamma-glutamyl-gamma-aminobutyrate hydrolase family protein n=1 Tax=Alicyclobacillus tolerans TaxID=90970 RepID=UPI00101ADB02|nr:gamma-glutamyl-gamma-aminobutyrate hydrolase family protein [Alicyclobacillus montanus]